MVSAAVLAGLLNYLVLSSGDEQVLVAVARVPLDPGTAIDPEVHLEFLPIVAADDLLARMTTDPEQVRGATVVRPLDAGAPVLPEALLGVGVDPGLRVLSIPVDRHLAAGGILRRGDTVDVVAVEEGEPRVLAEGIVVLATSGSTGGFGKYHVVVVVPRAGVPELAVAIDGSTMMLVRAGAGA